VFVFLYTNAFPTAVHFWFFDFFVVLPFMQLDKFLQPFLDVFGFKLERQFF